MARLLVVSRSMALALRLADSHEVVEHPAEALDSLDPGDQTDVVVLDVGEPAAAVSVLDALRRRGSTVPVLIVSGYQPAWAGLAALDLPGVVVVPLPITRTALLTGIERLEAGRRARSGVPAVAVTGPVVAGGRPYAPPADELPTMVVPAVAPQPAQAVPAPDRQPVAAEPFRHPGIPEPGYYTETGRPATPDEAPGPAAATVVEVPDVVDLRETDAPVVDDASAVDDAADVADAAEVVGDGIAPAADTVRSADDVSVDDDAASGAEAAPADVAAASSDDTADATAGEVPTAPPGTVQLVAEPNLPVSFVAEAAPPPTVLRESSPYDGPKRPAPSSAHAPGGQFTWWPPEDAHREPADLFVPARPISPHEALTEAIDLSALQAAVRTTEDSGSTGTEPADLARQAEAADGQGAPDVEDAVTPADEPAADAEPAVGDVAAADGDVVAEAVADDAELPTLAPPTPDGLPTRPEVVDLPATFLAPGEQTVDWAPLNGHAPVDAVSVEVPPVVAQVVEVAAAAPVPGDLPDDAHSDADTDPDAADAVSGHEAVVEESAPESADETAPESVQETAAESVDETAAEPATDGPVELTELAANATEVPVDATEVIELPADEEPSAPPASEADSELLSFDEVLFGRSSRPQGLLPAARHASGEIPLPGTAEPAAEPGAHRSQAPEPAPGDAPSVPFQAPAAWAPPVTPPPSATPPPLPAQIGSPWSPQQPPPLPGSLRDDILAEVRPAAAAAQPTAPVARPEGDATPGTAASDADVDSAAPDAALDAEAATDTEAASDTEVAADTETSRDTETAAAGEAAAGAVPDDEPTADALDPEAAESSRAADNEPEADGRAPEGAAAEPDRVALPRVPVVDEDHWSVEETASMVAKRRALLGRDAAERQPSALQRRLGDRRVSTGLSTGGASPELVALSRGIDDGGAPPTRRSLWGRTPEDTPPKLPPAHPAPGADTPAAASVQGDDAPWTIQPHRPATEQVRPAPDADVVPGPSDGTVAASDEPAASAGTARPVGAPAAAATDVPDAEAPAAPVVVGGLWGSRPPATPPAPAAFVPAVEASPWGRPFHPPVAPPPWAPPAPDLRSAPPPAVPATEVAPPPAAVPAALVVPPPLPTAAPVPPPLPTSPAPVAPPPLPGIPQARLEGPATRPGRLDPPDDRPLQRLEPPAGLVAPVVALAPDLAVVAPDDAPDAPEAAPDDAAVDALAGTPVDDSVLDRRSAPSARALVRALAERGSELFGVADTCQVLAQDVVERAVADAAAVVVPDGSVWRVSGGVGLRPIERRLVLDARHWLVTEVALGGQALVVGDSESVRPRLAGAPLAGWEHLLAVPVPEVNAAVVVARSRNGRPFTQDDLEAVVGPVQEAVGLLSAAVATRRLARMLAPFTEDDES